MDGGSGIVLGTLTSLEVEVEALPVDQFIIFDNVSTSELHMVLLSKHDCSQTIRSNS